MRRFAACQPRLPLVLEELSARLPANSSLAGDWLLAGLWDAGLDAPEKPVLTVAAEQHGLAPEESRAAPWDFIPEVPPRATGNLAPAAAPSRIHHKVEDAASDPFAPSQSSAGLLEAAAAIPALGEQPAAPARLPVGVPAIFGQPSVRGSLSSNAALLGVSGGVQSGSRNAIIPSQFIAKHYSEALGRIPDPGGWNSSLDFFAGSGCDTGPLKTWGRSVYLSPEFNSFPYDNAARLLALYRGALNREPDEVTFPWMLDLLNQGYPWSGVVDLFYNSDEFQSWTPWICTGYSYSFGYFPPLALPPSGGGFPGGTGQELQAILDRTPAGQTVWLAQKAVVRISQPLILPPRVTIATMGTPPHNHYARMGRLVRATNFNESAVQLRDGARLQSVWVDGARNFVGYRQNAINVQLFGGTGTTVADSVITNTAGWSSLQAFGRAENQPCTSNTLVRNLVTAYSSGHFDGTWADGLSVACENTLVENNEIVDATDVPIVLFRATPAVQRSQIRNNRILNAGNSAYGGLVADPLRSGQTHDFTGSVVENNTLWTGPNTWYVIAISVGTRAWFGTQSDLGHGARFVNNTTGSMYLLANTGIGVSGMLNATVQGNTGSIWIFRAARCPVVQVGASVNAGNASGNLQAYTDVLIQGCIGY